MIDFSKATQDPYDPRYLNPVYDANAVSASTADSLHPGDVGYEAMAATVPLAFVR